MVLTLANLSDRYSGTRWFTVLNIEDLSCFAHLSARLFHLRAWRIGADLASQLRLQRYWSQGAEMWNLSRKPQAKDTLEEREIPSRLWEVVGTDLFSWKGDEHLLMCDHYSKFPIIKKVHVPNGQSMGQMIVKLTKCVMSEHRSHNFWQWPPVWLSQLQAVLRRMGFSAHNFEPEIPTIQWVHWTTSSDCQKHFRQG